MSNVYRWLQSQSRPLVISAGFLFVLLIGLLDYLSGPELSFGLFYLIPVILVSWLAGRQEGILIALSCGLAWFVADISWPLNVSNPGIAFYNLICRTISFGVAALMVS